MPHARAPPPAEPWAWQAGGERTGVARFCHLIHIIMGVSLLDGGGELIAPITVSPCLRLLNSSTGSLSLSPGRRHKIESPPSVFSPPSFASGRPHLSHPLAFPVPYLYAYGVAGEQVPPEPSSACEPCTGWAKIRFLGSNSTTAHLTSSSW